MGKNSNIEWTDASWNPWRGCHKVSAGCKHCYMFREQKRYGRDPNVVVRSKTTFKDPLKWAEPRMIFTCSWSDWFVEEADPWRDEAWEIIRQTPQHTYQILTKRPENIRERLPFYIPPNVWLGISVENQRAADERIPIIHEFSEAYTVFYSVEPLLGHVDLDLLYYVPDWVIVGGESGPKSRQMDLEWARSVVLQCKYAGVPVFVKQLGGWPDKRGDIDKFPADLQVREMP